MNDATNTEAPAVGSPVDRGVGRLEPERATLTALADPVADALDDMAALGQHWTRNRERGRMPNGLRAAMLLVAREVLAHADAQEREVQRRFSELCGPQAYGRHNAAGFTPLQRGEMAGDGKPCPNNHDPDCRWPQCNCRQRGQ